jgi:peptidoglycan LD-endopeptidase CwlK
MSRDILALSPEMVEKCITFLKRANAAVSARGLRVKVISTGRSYDEQQALYAKGRTRPGESCHHLLPPFVRPVGTCKKHPFGATVTNAEWGESPHDYGLAFDVCFSTNGKDVLWNGPWSELAAIGASLGLEWGGAWQPPKPTDQPHFQLTNWRQHIPKES